MDHTDVIPFKTSRHGIPFGFSQQWKFWYVEHTVIIRVNPIYDRFKNVLTVTEGGLAC